MEIIRHAALFLVVLLWSFLAVSCVVFTDGNLAVMVENKGHEISSCAVYPARNGFWLSGFLKSRPVSEVIEVDIATINQMAAKCPYYPTRPSSRERRRALGIFFNMFRGIYPGTKWCGDGHIADNYDDLGYFRRTDACCREHDHCEFNIPQRTSRYGVYNDSPYTMSNCDCEVRFKRCLRKVGSQASSVITIFYFAFGRLKCFRFKKD